MEPFENVEDGSEDYIILEPSETDDSVEDEDPVSRQLEQREKYRVCRAIAVRCSRATVSERAQRAVGFLYRRGQILCNRCSRAGGFLAKPVVTPIYMRAKNLGVPDFYESKVPDFIKNKINCNNAAEFINNQLLNGFQKSVAPACFDDNAHKVDSADAFCLQNDVVTAFRCERRGALALRRSSAADQELKFAEAQKKAAIKNFLSWGLRRAGETLERWELEENILGGGSVFV